MVPWLQYSVRFRHNRTTSTSQYRQRLQGCWICRTIPFHDCNQLCKSKNLVIVHNILRSPAICLRMFSGMSDINYWRCFHTACWTGCTVCDSAVLNFHTGRFIAWTIVVKARHGLLAFLRMHASAAQRLIWALIRMHPNHRDHQNDRHCQILIHLPASASTKMREEIDMKPHETRPCLFYSAR